MNSSRADILIARRVLRVFAIACLTVGWAACSPSPETDTGDANDSGSEIDTAESADTTDTTATDGGETDVGDESTPLVTNSAWERLDESNDPLASHRPSSVECAEEAVEPEDLQGERTLSIDTDRCNYFAVRQQTLADVDSGDTLEVRVWHFELTHDESAEAHVALALDGEVVWEELVDLPTDSGALLTDTWTASKAYPTDTRVDLHLHNHGANNWNFIEFSKVEQ